jgi:two-component system cell cycle sensor histidine kinase/response regulator CckA
MRITGTHFFRPLAAGFVVFVVTTVSAAALIWNSEKLRMQAERNKVVNIAGGYAQVIQQTIDRSLSSTYALAALVRKGNGSLNDFAEIAREMLPFYPGAALGLAPGGIVKSIIPLVGNEGAIGHDMLKDPARAKESVLAKETGKLTLAGPFELKQGGIGAVARLPVYLDNDQGQRSFWGFTTVLIRFPETLEPAGLSHLVTQGFQYELWRIHPDTGQKQVISASSSSPLIKPVEGTLQLPNGSWTLSVVPTKGWGDPLGLSFKIVLGLMFGLMLGYITILMAKMKNHEMELEEQILIRTSALEAKIVEQKRAEDVLLASEKRFRTLVNTIPDLIWLKDADGVYLSCNAMFECFFGAKEADIVGKTDYDFVNKELADFFRENDRKAMTADQPSSNEEWVTFADNGHHALLYTTKTPLKDGEGKLVGVLGIGRDITELKSAVEAMSESERRLRHALEGSNDGLWDVQLKSGRTYLSPRSCEILGYREDELKDLLEVWSDLVHPDDLHITNERLQAHIEGRTAIFEVEQRLRTKSGDWKWIHTRGKVVERDLDGTPLRITGTHSDITDKKTLESQLHQAQKMESIGQLAGGVAHDFNNMLAVIKGYAELTLKKMEPSQPHYGKLIQIRIAAERSADLTRQLLAFARKQTIAPKVVDLNETVSGMLNMLQRLIGENINLTLQTSSNLWLVKVDPSQIDQMLVNLCVNARQAIEDVGRIAIETGNSELDANYCATHRYVEPGEYVRLVVSDDGGGMDKETQTHIFEPFFTTKGVGHGTGLGLATVYGIVKQNNGFIDVYSEPGQGTTFTIYLPRHMGEIEQTPKEGQAEPVPLGNETILLVEDEPSILMMAALMLEGQGYTVLTAGTASEAIRLFKEQTGGIHLLITDVVMPDMNGRDLVNELQSLHPQLNCLFMSGYTADVIASHGVLDEGVNFIQKPFSLPDLATKVREVLDSHKKNG